MSQSGSNQRPVIGITMDVVEDAGRIKVDCSLAYAECVAAAGGVPVMLPPVASLVREHVAMCDGFVLTGGDDPKMEPFGVATHAMAKVIHPRRQEYEVALLAALKPDVAVLGVCLGMQLMSLHAGGTLNQHLPDSLATHARHKKAEHEIVRAGDSALHLPARGMAWSNHRQAVESAGAMVVVARSDDGVVEAVAHPKRKFWVGVQWHPERTAAKELGANVFESLVKCAREG